MVRVRVRVTHPNSTAPQPSFRCVAGAKLETVSSGVTYREIPRAMPGSSPPT